MSTSYNATVELDMLGRKAPDSLVEHVIDDLAEYAAAVTTAPTGHLAIILSVDAASLTQAVRTAVAVAESSTGRTVVAVAAMTTDDFYARAGLEPVPELLSVTQAAEQLGTSRQAVLQRLETGSLAGQKVGNAWVVQRAAVDRREPRPAARG
ncbi:helix-turn-helix domain-containing protein [Georgenia sp. TF02-10]|uniref:helix-turn-helix domain-containing protein n=1 Tax=Georgenia sp. TF02-10 TaxID=2917725 RepID=UPI001FA79ECE|nr:helix-turn-helix domain-containing protein [Georgenia sp. TF02-10]UNX55244.1 helix-turn-helix domain-containing protein [Georgenia sp. TF02-10]